jgi:hypothetical protein
VGRINLRIAVIAVIAVTGASEFLIAVIAVTTVIGARHFLIAVIAVIAVTVGQRRDGRAVRQRARVRAGRHMKSV